MKKIKLALLALTTTIAISITSVYASFPVKNETKTEQTTSASTSSQNNTVEQSNSSIVTKAEKLNPTNTKDLDEKWITLILWFFLGAFAAHRWYKKKPIGWNILYIITLGGCGIWAIVDLINILTDNF